MSLATHLFRRTHAADAIILIDMFRCGWNPVTMFRITESYAMQYYIRVQVVGQTKISLSLNVDWCDSAICLLLWSASCPVAILRCIVDVAPIESFGVLP
jgi:hypothetical protein